MMLMTSNSFHELPQVGVDLDSCTRHLGQTTPTKVQPGMLLRRHRTDKGKVISSSSMNNQIYHLYRNSQYSLAWGRFKSVSSQCAAASFSSISQGLGLHTSKHYTAKGSGHRRGNSTFTRGRLERYGRDLLGLYYPPRRQLGRYSPALRWSR